jgi:hypothetical protein
MGLETALMVLAIAGAATTSIIAATSGKPKAPETPPAPDEAAAAKTAQDAQDARRRAALASGGQTLLTGTGGAPLQQGQTQLKTLLGG